LTEPIYSQDNLLLDDGECSKCITIDTINYLPFVDSIFIPDGVTYIINGELPSATFKLNKGYLKINPVWNTFPNNSFYTSLLSESDSYKIIHIYNKDVYYKYKEDKIYLYFNVSDDINSDNRWMFKVTGILNIFNRCEFIFILKEYIKKAH